MIEIKGLRKEYDGKVIFDKYNLLIQDSELVFITGKSGCGKSTLLNIIGGLEKFDGGSVLAEGFDVGNLKSKRKYYKSVIGFLFQNFALMENKTVRQNLELVKYGKNASMTIEKALEKVGLEGVINTKVYKLSGGEQQRIALARLLIKECSIVLADEPTGSLDKENAEFVMGMLREMNKCGKTVIIVTHDNSLIKKGERVEKI